ncbi:hypothetical protein OCU04_004298 [Sclerotinia nivalis]|uniref:Uncharacterized protein n=1 Tax=Sclerotinia nivalis TaxID=352851 RepID=A0A9X0ATK0_9HELO|nr:hypothetical protein OCU04_004298 [Sclerotinia nivalis]
MFLRIGSSPAILRSRRDPHYKSNLFLVFILLPDAHLKPTSIRLETLETLTPRWKGEPTSTLWISSRSKKVVPTSEIRGAARKNLAIHYVLPRSIYPSRRYQ